MSVPRSARGWVALVPLAAACGGYDAPAPLLSASRLVLVEGEEARVDVDVARADELELGPATPPWIRPVVDGGAVGLAIAPGCAVAHGADHEAIVEVVDRRGGRTAALVITVEDSAVPACVADVVMWLARGDCATPPGVTPPLVAGDRAAVDRLCLRARPADPDGRPITALELRLEPASRAFGPLEEAAAAADGTRVAWRRLDAGAGAIPDWLVGELTAGYRITAGAAPIALTLEASGTLAVGAPGEVGLELGAPADDAPGAFVAREFDRAIVPVTVHRFPGTATTLVVEPDRAASAAAIACQPTPALRLYRVADDLAIAACERHPLAADGDPHERYRLAYVPAIDADARMVVPLTLPDLAPPRRRDVEVDVSSRADDLALAAPVRQLACAHLAGAPTVIAATDAGTRLWRLPGWRRAGAIAVDVAGQPTGPMVVLPSTTDVEVLAARGDELVRLRDTGGGWAWDVALAVRGLPRELVGLRSPTAAAPDWLAGVVRAGGQIQLRLVRRSDGAGPPPFALFPDLPGEYTLGVVDVDGHPGDELVLVTPASALEGDRTKVRVLALRWTGGQPDRVTETGVALATDLRGGPRRTIGARRDGSGGAELWIAVGDGAVSFGVAAFAVSADGQVFPLAAEGGRSAASGPDGSVLIAGEIGVQRRPPGLLPARQIDPARRETGLDYGAQVAPCVAGAGLLDGFVVQTAATTARAARHDIVVETP